ncbi:SIP domain-containing protein [Leifsonia sp. NPDC058194]|uniref:SIP domain-containing protein n=1 Tax=Leifsonia sp. NPDC058194 TaxID=3346374 RepID=UPI0036DDFF7F
MPAHFLLVGDETDLPVLQPLVTRLPVDAYGQIFLEVGDGMDAMIWPVPPGIQLTWLPRGDGLAVRGDLAMRAVSAWIDEWMPESMGEEQAPFVMWLGCRGNAGADRVFSDLGARIEARRARG